MCNLIALFVYSVRKRKQAALEIAGLTWLKKTKPIPQWLLERELRDNASRWTGAFFLALDGSLGSGGDDLIQEILGLTVRVIGAGKSLTRPWVQRREQRVLMSAAADALIPEGLAIAQRGKSGGVEGADCQVMKARGEVLPSRTTLSPVRHRKPGKSESSMPAAGMHPKDGLEGCYSERIFQVG